MQTITENGKVTEARLNKEEFKAFEIISNYKNLGLPPRDMLKELQKENISQKNISTGTKAHFLSKNGVEIIQGDHYIYREHGWRDKESSDF